MYGQREEAAPAADHGHGGWRYPGGSRRRWLEPFVLLLVAEGTTHGYGIMAGLESMAVSAPAVDVGQIYRVLRNLEAEGSVASAWSTDRSGPARREYQLTPAGWSALEVWAGVMEERLRLAGEFLVRFDRLSRMPRTPAPERSAGTGPEHAAGQGNEP